MSAPVVFILGAGPNVGTSIASKFAAEGWKVAAASRSPKDEIKKIAHHVMAADFSDAEKISSLFAEVEAKLGIPNVVIYNAYSVAFSPNGSNPFSFSVAEYAKDIAVNTTSVYAAASTALAGFRKLPDASPTVFIYTGNMQSSLIVPEVVSLGAGKNASAYLMETAAAAYGAKHQFYYADERLPDGRPVMAQLSGEAHAGYYFELATRKTQGPWDATFVKGVGYKRFEGERDREVTPAGMLTEHVNKALKVPS
ncbi:hypothetical protein MMC26_004328 [Xylographa opegraphella]|nr:hypothetical protein [Xylographa opegraphella]